jgi:phage shock protein PspC (stress-responsive transcriptional regulator)
MAGGVCGGLAEYSGIDPLLWRVGFVALAFAGGSGVLVYLLLWLLIPSSAPGAGTPVMPFDRIPRRRRPLEPRSPVPGVTIAGLLIVVGALVLITRLTGWTLAPRAFLGAALLVVGLGLVAAAFTGGRRSRGGLIALGIVLSLAATASTASWHWHWHNAPGVGDRVFRPLTAAEVQRDYNGGVGDMTVDLTGVDLSNVHQPITTRIDHALGDVFVRVPASADVSVNVDNGLGNVDLFKGAGYTNGIYPGTGSASWTNDGNPEFMITISSGVGDVEVSRG